MLEGEETALGELMVGRLAFSPRSPKQTIQVSDMIFFLVKGNGSCIDDDIH